MQPDQSDQSEHRTIVFTSEPPASVGSPGAQPVQTQKMPYIVLVSVIILAAIGAVFAVRHFSDAGNKLTDKLKPRAQSERPQSGSQKDTARVDNQCVSFALPTKIPVNIHGPLCYASAESFDNSVTVELLPADVSEANLQKRAQADFARQYPNATSSDQAGRFAGRASYSMLWSDSDSARTSTRYYVYNSEEGVTVRGVAYHAYSILFSGRTDTFSLIKNIENSWKWKSVAEDSKNEYEEVPVSSAVTPCYDISAASVAKVYSQGGCTLRAVSDAQTMNDVSIRNLTGRQLTAKDYADQWKYYSKTTVVLSESALRVDGRDAYKIVYRSKATPNDGQRIIVFVPTGESYTAAGDTPGLEISGNYSTKNDSQKFVDTLTSNWRWKK